MKKNTNKKKVNTLIRAFETKDAKTANGAVTHSTSSSTLVDFFGMGAAARNQTDQFVLQLFNAASSEDQDTALKTLFYIRDIRGGQGERKVFRTCFRDLAQSNPEVAKKLLKYVPEFGRWDDVLETLEGTTLEADAMKLLAATLRKDVKSEKPTLCAKWAPSEQASSANTKRLAKKLREYMKMTPKQYRKMLSSLRAKINVVERLMCANQWSDIEFGSVTSRASMLYKDAFKKHQEARYTSYLAAVEKGTEKINSSTLYPYELSAKALYSDDKTIELQWRALPDYLAENPHNGLVVADVSGSMMSSLNGQPPRPLDVSLSLALYFAERNKGAFQNYFLTFSSASSLVKVTGNTLHKKLTNISQSQWGMSTDLQSAFSSILKHAVDNNVPESDMPSVLYIVSDMEFNSCCQGATNMEAARAKYKNAGYKLPRIVFWNVNAVNKQSPVKFDEKGTCLVSGCSPAILKSVLSAKIVTPYEVMMETINSPRYKNIHS